jgi:hypothetical protein
MHLFFPSLLVFFLIGIHHCLVCQPPVRRLPQGGFIANVAPGISGSQDATEDHGPHDTSVAAALCDGTPVQEAMPETN